MGEPATQAQVFVVWVSVMFWGIVLAILIVGVGAKLTRHWQEAEGKGD